MLLVVEKMGNENNHIHLMIGIRKDGYKEVDDYCNIFGEYWKIFGSCLFVEYDGEKGLFGDYMFKGFDEWDFFETEFGGLRKKLLFYDTKQNINMKSNNLFDFVFYTEGKKTTIAKTVKNSIIGYIDKELEAIQDNYKGSELELKPRGDGKVKDIRCWGDVKNGERRLSLMCKNKKVYLKEDDAKEGKIYRFGDTSKECVIETLNNIKRIFDSEKNEDIKLWYVKKNKDTKEEEIFSIHDL